MSGAGKGSKWRKGTNFNSYYSSSFWDSLKRNSSDKKKKTPSKDK